MSLSTSLLNLLGIDPLSSPMIDRELKASDSLRRLELKNARQKIQYVHLHNGGMNEPASSIVVHPPEGPDIDSSIVTALQFLRDDNGYRASFIKNEVAEYTYARESVDAAVIVAAFIAGVQSQIIASTLDKKNTTIQIVTNVVGFLELVFDILGASIGVIHAVKLKKSISEAQVPDHLFIDNERLTHIREILSNTSTEEQTT
ncbi:hypothetical protein M422DRAFT_56714 [Sphaerobolus stellatus SS14]|uniref:Uncharacterized protein n=1 Tax=Sphaerobolus stellatus (strain SS14) TaxID=990650 RepID=A0A0C9U3P5_SPHS4|nr:hypothetical protein M422DRAFT_56714 [Sphaerobolus stellatus SS14]